MAVTVGAYKGVYRRVNFFHQGFCRLPAETASKIQTLNLSQGKKAEKKVSRQNIG